MSAKRRKRPLPRRKAFFGLHFDLHPKDTDTSLGADICEDNIAHLLERVGPDYVQYDCKGHAGYTGYPTKVGWASPGIVNDSLAVWRKVTREYGVGLYIHYSGVWDSVALKHHPEWARLDAEGKPDDRMTSTFGPYVDELMIPQLKEVAAAYDLDGVWVDGDCWGVQLDYSPAAVAAWRAQTGLDHAPADRSDPHWLEWKMFHRRRFEWYLARWVDALHKFRRRFQITSNWMYTTYAPKPVEVALDFLSGDYSPMASVDRARVEARYLAHTGMPWDLMAWGFNWSEGVGKILKPAVHLQQEAAVVLMQGGGFQIYYQPTRSGWVPEQAIETSGQVADFCRARQKVSHRSTTVPQVAVLLSTESMWDRSDVPFHSPNHLHELEGALHALLELNYSVDVMAEHQLQPRLAEFPLVILPDAHKLAEDFRQALLDHVRGGGGLLLLGWQSGRLFPEAVGASLEGEPEGTISELACEGGVVNSNGLWQKVTPTSAEAIAYRHPTQDTRKNAEVAATLAPYGEGHVAAVWGPVALTYYRTHHSSLRRLLGDIVHRVFPEPAFTTDAPPFVDLALRRTAGGRLSLHLLNLAQAQRAGSFLSTDVIPEIGPIEVRLRLPHRPRRVRWVPSGGRLKWSWADGVLSARIPSLHIHGVLVAD